METQENSKYGLIIFRLGMLIIILLGGGLDDKRSRTEFHRTIYLFVPNKWMDRRYDEKIKLS